jgi:hypothetical protein
MRTRICGLLILGLTTIIQVTTPIAAAATPPATVLTLEIGGDLFRHGGVVVVYPIPTEAGATDAAREPAPLRLEARFAQVQLRYPTGGSYIFRFRPAESGPATTAFRTQLLSIIGTDMDGVGDGMREGFTGAHASGGQIVRVLPQEEWGGADEATRANARWGWTQGQGYDAPPPADARGARALMGVMDDSNRRVPLRCTGDARVQACTVEPARWAAVEARWWRAIAEGRLERLEFHALNRCYAAQQSQPRDCKPDPDSDEPRFR